MNNMGWIVRSVKSNPARILDYDQTELIDRDQSSIDKSRAKTKIELNHVL